MNLIEFATEKRALYTDFARAVSVIFDSALSSHDRPLQRYMRHRAKSVGSLRKKLSDRDLVECDNVEIQIFDLAGCRAIFFDDADIDYVRTNQIIQECFDVDWDRSKIHHGDVETAEVNELYRGIHYVIRLKEDRAALPEYRRFAGLYCEIQLQTILTHAWSETAHDIIYKPRATEAFGGTLMEDIKKRMSHIMAKHIVPAGYAFTKVRRDYDRLARGLDIVEEGGLKGLAKCQNNNERYELIQDYSNYVLPHLETVRDEHGAIVASLLDAAEAARNDTTPELETPFGSYRGHEADNVIEAAIGVLSWLRYIEVGLTLDAYCRLYDFAESDDTKKRVFVVVKSLASHNLQVWQSAGSAVQTELMEIISNWDPQTRDRYREIALTVSEQALGTEAERTTETSSSMTLHRGAVIGCDELAAARAKAITCVAGYYPQAASEEERRRLINILLHGTYEPDKPNEALREIICRDAATIVSFLEGAAVEADYSFRQHIEHQVHYVHRRLNQADDPKCKALNENISAFRTALGADEDFQIYKILVGFESVFPPAWDDASFEYEAEEEYRRNSHTPLIETITPETHELWRKRLNICASTKSRDLATLPPFHEFLNRVGAERPLFAFEVLSDQDNDVVNFAASLLEGIEQSDRKEFVETITNDWLAAGQSLWALFVRVQNRDTFDLDLLAQTTKRAIEVGDDFALRLAMGTVAKRIKDGDRPLIDQVFWPAFIHFQNKDEWDWIRTVSLRLKDNDFFTYFSAEEITEIFDNLIEAPKINHQVERILEPIAASFSAEIVKYFGKRVSKGASYSEGAEYEPIPYKLHKLPAAIKLPAKDFVEAVFEWRDPDGEPALGEAARFTKQCYRDLPDTLAKKLRSMVADGTGEERKFAMTVLRLYEGSEIVLPIVKQLALLTKDHPDLEGDLFTVLMPSGISSGEYGYRNRLAARLKDIEPWMKDENDIVSGFASRISKILARDIASETRRSEQGIAQRKSEFDEDIEGQE